MVEQMKNQSSYQPAVLMRKLNNSEYELRKHFEENNIKVEIKKIEKMKETDMTMLKAKQTASKLCVNSVSAQQFQCYICALEFKLQDTLTLHLDKVHQIFDEKVYAKLMKEVSSTEYFTPLTSSTPKAPTSTISKPPTSTLQYKTPCTSLVKAAKENASIVTDSSCTNFPEKDELSDYKPNSDLVVDGGGFSDGYDSDLDWINPKAKPVDEMKDDLKYVIESELMDVQVDLDDKDKPVKLISKLKSKAAKTKLHRNVSKRPSRRSKKRSHKCTHCDGIFHGNTEYLIHLSETHGLKKKPFHCKLCPSQFSRSLLLDSHIAEVHDGTVVFTCKYCQQKFVKRCHLDAHVDDFHESGPIVKCPVCGVEHSEKKMLRHQIAAHTVEESVQCKLCENIFPKQIRLSIHMKRYHSLKKPVPEAVCPQCGKIMSSARSLETHIKFVHEKQYNYVCETCNRKCGKPSELKRHIEFAHQGIKIFSCDMCDHRVSSKVLLPVHKFAKHGVPMPFSCEICAKGFPSSTLVNFHVKKDHDKVRHKCTVCSREFGVKSSMKRHMEMVHQCMKPYKCPECEISFGYKHSMDRHYTSVHCDLKQKSRTEKPTAQPVNKNEEIGEPVNPEEKSTDMGEFSFESFLSNKQDMDVDIKDIKLDCF